MESAPEQFVAPGSEAERKMELMDKIPPLMEEITKNYQETEKLKFILERIETQGGIGDPSIRHHIDNLYIQFSNQKTTLMAEMEKLITELENCGYGFVVQGARESLGLLK